MRLSNRLIGYYDMYKKLFPEKNLYTINNEKAQERKVNLNWYSAKAYGMKEENLGDYLSFVIVEYMKKRLGIDDSEILKETRFLYAVGSVLNMGLNDAAVWGSGFLRDVPRSKSYRAACNFRKLDIRCVRGPKTRDQLIKLGYTCPEIYGDPALLMPLIYTPKQVTEKEKKDCVVVKHMYDITDADNCIDILTRDYKGFIDSLIRYKKVISSSLHGIILAEAYGVPAVLYIPSNMNPEIIGHNMNIFKYTDYYHSTLRYKFPVARSVKEAMAMEPCELPDITGIQENLINTFPKDLWEF